MNHVLSVLGSILLGLVFMAIGLAMLLRPLKVMEFFQEASDFTPHLSPATNAYSKSPPFLLLIRCIGAAWILFALLTISISVLGYNPILDKPDPAIPPKTDSHAP
jgi:hypothetical protein